MADNKIVVLIIDDNEVDRYTFSRYLRETSSEYEVHEAANGKSGLDLAASLRPDCVLLDLNLVEQSGFEVLNELAGHETYLKVPVIMLTGHRWDALKKGALGLGAVDFLLKHETDATRLGEAVRRALTSVSSDKGAMAKMVVTSGEQSPYQIRPDNHAN
ncbi:MAG TPA: response regulator [Nitrospira sp.]|nr:response regulator [Nitrospira sp.]